MSCVKAEGYVDAAAVLNAKRYEALLISSIVPFVAAVDATNYAKDRASRLDALSQRQISLAEEELAYNQLAWPCEENAIAEAQAPDAYVPIYDVVVGRAQVPIKHQFAKAKLDIKKKYNRYNRGAMTASLAKLCNAQSMAVADAQMLAYRAEQAKADARDDRDWNRRIEISALGKNIAQQASGFYKSAGAGLGGMQSAAMNAFNTAIGQLGNAYNTYANSSPYVASQYLYEQQASMKVQANQAMAAANVDPSWPSQDNSTSAVDDAKNYDTSIDYSLNSRGLSLYANVAGAATLSEPPTADATTDWSTFKLDATVDGKPVKLNSATAETLNADDTKNNITLPGN